MTLTFSIIHIYDFLQPQLNIVISNLRAIYLFFGVTDSIFVSPSELINNVPEYLVKSCIERNTNFEASRFSKESGNITVSRNYIADQDELADILYHELETHMRRLERSANLPCDIFRIGTASYLFYEEGLATLSGHSAKKIKISGIQLFCC